MNITSCNQLCRKCPIQGVRLTFGGQGLEEFSDVRPLEAHYAPPPVKARRDRTGRKVSML